MSSQHLWSAAYLATMADSVEIEYEQSLLRGGGDELLAPYLAFVCSSIFASAGCVEAAINEVLADAHDGTTELAAALGPQRCQALATVWATPNVRERWSVMRKFDEVLARCGAAPFDRAGDPSVSFGLVLNLRNQLIHPAPEWSQLWDEAEVARILESDDAEPTYDRGGLESQLAGRFHSNPFTVLPPNFFPTRLLSRDCAEWALASSLAFLDSFYSRLGLPAPYEDHREHLETRIGTRDNRGGPYPSGWL